MKAQNFELGKLVMTGKVNNRVSDDEEFAKFVQNSLDRHIKGDWGDLDKEDKKRNDRAVEEGNLRILSAYENENNKIWIITEADRSATTILFPREY